CAYESSFPHQLAYFKNASHYVNQTSVNKGKMVGSKPNLYSLFVEQCFNLLHPSGECGLVIPSGIYSDLGTKQLREMLFSKTQITGLFGFENRRLIFEGVDSRFKFVVLTFGKGKDTKIFPAKFMRQELAELLRFPGEDCLNINVDIIRHLSPDSLSVIEFHSQTDVDIAAKLLNFPLFSDSQSGWGIELYGEELNMTRSSSYFKTAPTTYPVYKGSMIWHFDCHYSKACSWIQELELKNSFLKKRVKRIKNLTSVPIDMKNDYETYRIAIRKIARNTDTRTLITTIIPPNSLAGNSLSVNFPFYHTYNRYNELRISNVELVSLVAFLNSLVSDYVLRARMNTNLNLFYLYQLPVPRLTAADRFFAEIVDRAAKLICTTPEFDELAQEVGLTSHQDGVTDEGDRAQLRAELDGIIAHIYGLNEEEFTYILSTFPLVSESVKEATLEAYRNFAPLAGDPEIINLITQGEGHQLEFKSTARWNLRENKKDKAMEHEIVKTVAGFLNANGGTLLIGVNDDGVPLGLKSDYQTLKKNSPDGLALFLNNDLLLREIGKECGTLWQITVHQVSGFELCRVVVQPSPKPIYVKVKDKAGKEEDCFYLRSNNST
ncbi:MAG: RNA-binding domain-containing protein, partial [Planktothrix sp.]